MLIPETVPQADGRPQARGHKRPAEAPQEHSADLRRLARELTGHTDAVVAGMGARTSRSGVVLDDAVEESFAQVGVLSTVAVAKWMAGDGIEVARDVGQESWCIFGQLAAQRRAPLNEVTKRCLRWFDAASDVAREAAAELALAPEVLAQAIAMLQRSLNVTLVRMCESFEAERKRSDEELTFLATHDVLSGLPNRKLILDRTEQLLARARRHGTPVAAVFIDLDNFKLINDTLGHGAGDELLCAVTARLQSAVRETDTLGRLGGDEFVVIAEETSLAAGPELIAERLLEALGEPFTLAEGAARLKITASVGVAVGVRSSADELLRDADIAMYRAKCNGKDRYVAFESEMQGAVQSRLELEMDLREALQNDEFFLVYQPIFNLTDMSPSALEALIRWEHPTRGVVQPEDFIPLLEETGLITEIGGWVLREACARGANWRAAGCPIEMAVNVSARQLDSDEFVTEVRDALEQRSRRAGPDDRDHRDDPDARRRADDPPAERHQGARRANRDRRLRHRLLLADPRAEVPGRRAEDRPVVHHRTEEQQRRRGAHPHARAAGQGLVDRDRGRGHRAAAGAVPSAG